MSESPHSGLQSQSVQGTNTQYVHISTRDVKKQAQVKTIFFCDALWLEVRCQLSV